MGIFTILLQILWVSVNWKRLIEKGGRYQRYVAGSYDTRGVGGAVIPESGFRGQPAANQPTGFFGSRMADSPSDKSLTEIYRRGKDAVEE